MFGLGFSEIIVVCIIALIFIGPKQLPEVAKAIAKFINELKRASEEVSRTVYSSKTYSEDEKDYSHHQQSFPQDKTQTNNITHPPEIELTKQSQNGEQKND